MEYHGITTTVEITLLVGFHGRNMGTGNIMYNWYIMGIYSVYIYIQTNNSGDLLFGAK